MTSHIQITAQAVAEAIAIERRRIAETLIMIADIAEGSTTANSLPHIAKIARAELDKWNAVG